MKTAQIDIQSEITNSLVRAFEAGAGKLELPWHKVGMKPPVNVASKNSYRGTNFLTLLLTSYDKGYSNNTWATFKQWKERGGVVRKGEKGTPIVFYKLMIRDEDQTSNGKTSQFPLLKHTHVFNIAQIEGLAREETQTSPEPSVIERHQKADSVIAATGAKIIYNGSEAYYRPSTDTITLPDKSLWRNTSTSSATEGLYSVTFHELTHWSGAIGRLDRDLSTSFGTQQYCFEELIAEISACFHCVQLGITPVPRPDHAAYISQYIQLMKSDKRAIFKAASAASQAYDYIMGFSEENPLQHAA